jgi:hypothetical protein
MVIAAFRSEPAAAAEAIAGLLESFRTRAFEVASDPGSDPVGDPGAQSGSHVGRDLSRDLRVAHPGR